MTIWSAFPKQMLAMYYIIMRFLYLVAFLGVHIGQIPSRLRQFTNEVYANNMLQTLLTKPTRTTSGMVLRDWPMSDEFR